MLCGSKENYQGNIFKIVRKNRLKTKSKTYIFVGNLEKDKRKVLEDYQISKKESLLKGFSSEIIKQIKNVKTKEFEFIFQGIYFDDSIDKIKKKIFAFLSTSSDLLFENNQELWVEYNGKKNILGLVYSNITYQPSLYEEIKPDYKHFVGKSGHSILIEKEVDNNDLILVDATNGLEMDNNTIYLNTLDDEIEYMKMNGIKIDGKILDGYVKKFFPKGQQDFDKDIVLQEREKLKKMLETEDKLINFVEKVPTDESYFTGCKIIRVLCHITNDYGQEFVDLFKIFSLFNLDEKTPFMRYKEPDSPTPYFIFYKPIIEKRIISQKQVEEWVKSKKRVEDFKGTVLHEVKYNTRGLTLKRYMYTLEGEPKYATLNFHRNGNIEINLSFKEKQETSMKDVYLALKDIGDLVKKINDIDYRFKQKKIPRTIKINQPQVSWDEKKQSINFGPNTNLILIDAINGTTLPEDFNYFELNSFGNNYFTPFLSPILSKKNYEKDRFLAKYKRVSNYSKMNEIYEFIHKTKVQSPDLKEEVIIKLIQENFYPGKPFDEPIRKYKEWERRYGFQGTEGGKKVRQTGVELSLLKGKLHINGAKTQLQLTDSSSFFAKFLNIYFNQKKYLSKAKDIFSNQLAKLEYVNENINLNVNNEQVNYGNFGNYGNFNINYNALNELEEEENAELERINEFENSNNKKYDFDRNAYLAKDKDIEKDIRMKCEDVVEGRDVCTDYCEDEFYNLRRLQKFDNAIFRYKSDNVKYKNYARQCQPQDRQPLVLKNDPRTDERINPKAFENVVKYGSSSDRQNYYICSRAWCPVEEIPIWVGDLVGESKIQKRPTIRKGVCLTAKCPSCLKKKPPKVTWLRIVDEKKFQPYVGFIDESKHPNNLCMPCCFKKRSDVWDEKTQKVPPKGYEKFKKCLGEDINIEGNTNTRDYIMGREKMPLTRARLGLLPVNLAKLFRSRCDTGKMKDGEECFLRYGVRDDPKQSFLWAIAFLVEEGNSQVTKDIFKKYLIDKVLTPKMFKSINHGELESLFDDGKKPAIDNFKDFLKLENERLNEEFLWDLLSRPGVLYKEGVNIFILTSRNLICPYGFDSKEFYDIRRKTIFLYTDGKYYEPIVFTRYKNGNVYLKKVFDQLDPEVGLVFIMNNNNCTSKNIINWNSIKKETLKNKYFETVKNLSATDVLKLYQNKIKGQYQDQYHKAIGFLTHDNFILPFKPQGILMEYNVYDNYQPKSLKDTLNFYYQLYKKGFPYKPIRVFRNNGEIIAVLLLNGSIISVIPSTMKTNLENAPGKYFSNANNYIAKNEVLPNERLEITSYLIFLNESYERLRMELAKEIQTSKYKDKIISLIFNKEINIKDKRPFLKDLVKKITDQIVVIVKELPFDISKYVKPPIRRNCAFFNKFGNKSEAQCIKSFHCMMSGKSCKLIILERNPVNNQKVYGLFLDKIVDELLRNKFLREEILEDKIDEIIDKRIIDYKNDEIVLDALSNIQNQIRRLYENKKNFFISDVNVFSKTEPKYFGINKEKFLVSNKNVKSNINLQPLPTFWEKLFGRSVKYIDERLENDSLYLSLVKICGEINPQIKSVKELKKLEIEKIDNATKTELNKDSLFNNKEKNMINRILNSYKKVDPSNFKTINTFKQLEEYLFSKDYVPNEIDLFFLNQILEINIIVIRKRKSGKNEDAKSFYASIYNLKKDFIVLIEQNRLNRKIFSPVIKNGLFKFPKRELPKIFRDKYKIKNEKSVLNISNSSNNNNV